MVAMATSTQKLTRALTTAAIATLCAFVAVTGCRKPHSGQTSLPPGTPGPIKDLTAIRVGDEISLNWTTPRKGMNKVIVNGSIKIRVCRLESATAACVEAGHPLVLTPSAAGAFTEDLPALMRSGPPRVAYYSIELLDRNENPTGLANRVPVLIGAPPPPVEGLVAEITEKGVVLKWNPDPARSADGDTTIRLRRTEGVDPVATQAMRDGLVPFPTRPETELSATDGSGGTLDPGTRRGTTYQYRAQRVFRIVIDGQTLEMDGQVSPEVQVELPSEPDR